MTRVKFYNHGINSLIKSNIYAASDNMDKAIYYCPKYVPTSLKCYNYLMGLRKTLEAYNKKIGSINEKSRKTDDELLKIFDRIDKIVKMDPLEKIADTGRLIK